MSPPKCHYAVTSLLTSTQTSTAGFPNPLELAIALWPYLPLGCICSGFLDICPSSLNISDGIHDGVRLPEVTVR
jgi:hypothetical protein